MARLSSRSTLLPSPKPRRQADFSSTPLVVPPTCVGGGAERPGKTKVSSPHALPSGDVWSLPVLNASL
jgi:hypothetical protein